GRSLFQADAAGDDVRPEVAFAANGRAGEAPEHGDLADVRERVRDGALEELLDRRFERGIRGEVSVKGLEGSKESANSFLPTKGWTVVPFFLAASDGKRPIHQVCQVREDLPGGS